MRAAAIGSALLVVLLMLLSAVPAASARTIDVVAFNAQHDFWFRVEGSDERNPEIRVEAGETVIMHFRNAAGMPHNLRVGGPIMVATPLLHPGQSVNLTVHVPDGVSGLHEYWCDPHKELLMRGNFHILEVGEAREEETPGPGAALFVLAALAAARLGRPGQRHRLCRSRE